MGAPVRAPEGTDVDARCRLVDRSPCPRDRDGGVREEHLLALASCKDRLTRHSSRRPFLEARLGCTVGRPIGEMPDGCDDSAWRRLRDEWRLAVVICRNRRSEPEREHEIISQHGQHAALHVLRSKRAAKHFLDGLDVEDDG